MCSVNPPLKFYIFQLLYYCTAFREFHNKAIIDSYYIFV